MMALATVISICGFGGVVWNLYISKDKKIDGSTVSLLFTFLVGVGLFFDPDSITLPFVNYKNKTKKEYEQAVVYSSALKELMAVQLWNQGRLPDEEKSNNNKEKAITFFKELYGDKYKEAIKSLSDSNTLMISEEESTTLNLDKKKSEIKPFSQRAIEK